MAKKISGRQLVAGGLVLLGFLLTVFIGVIDNATKQPSRSTSVLLVVLAGIFQLGGASQFYRSGRADPGLARAAVRRILKMASKTRDARKLVEVAYDTGSAADVRKALGRVSVELSWLEEGLLDAIGDWSEFHAAALHDLTEGIEDAGSD